MTTDVKLDKPAGSQFYDLSLDANGDLTNGDFFDTSLQYSLLGERRATASEIGISEFRRGWIGNENSDFENGSKIWLLRQARLTRTNLNQLQSLASNGLSWLVEDDILENIEVRALTRNGIAFLEITLFRFNSKVDTRFFELWNNTGAS